MTTTTRPASGWWNLVYDECDHCNWRTMPYNPVQDRHKRIPALEHAKVCPWAPHAYEFERAAPPGSTRA